MIAHIKGTLASRGAGVVVVQLSSGLGYEIRVTPKTSETLPQPPNEILLYTHLIVREDEHSLYGFATMQEKDLFGMLIKASGIGPKLALTILGATTPESFLYDIQSQNTKALSRIPGIGSKTAERLILELADRIKTLAVSPAAQNSQPASEIPTAQHEAREALLNLGFQSREVADIFANIQNIEQHDTATLIRLALQTKR